MTFSLSTLALFYENSEHRQSYFPRTFSQAFTPCMSENDAEQLEMGRMFVLSHFDQL